MTKFERLDPRKKACWEAYVNPDSPTFGNGRQSAISAGYSVSYADKILTLDWFSGLLRRFNMREKGEKVLDGILHMSPLVKAYKVPGDEQTAYMVTDTQMLKIIQDTAKFAVERLGKEDWSTRSEVTGAEGGPIVTEESKSKSDLVLDEFLNKNQGNTGIE